MPEWSQDFKFARGDRVKVVIPEEVKATDKQWASYDGRYGTIGRVHLQSQEPPYDPVFLRYRVDLETAPRGKGHILWCREEYLVKVRTGGKRAN